MSSTHTWDSFFFHASHDGSHTTSMLWFDAAGACSQRGRRMLMKRQAHAPSAAGAWKNDHCGFVAIFDLCPCKRINALQLL